MMKIIHFLHRERFNHIDMAETLWFGMCIATGRLGMAAMVFAAGFVLNVTLGTIIRMRAPQ